MVFNQAGQIPVKKGEHLVEHLHHSHLDPGQLQGLDRFHPDQPPADHHRAFDLFFVADPAQIVGVGHGHQVGDALKVDAGNGRHVGSGTGGDDQLVISYHLFLTGVQIAADHLFLRPVDRGDLGFGKGGDGLGLMKEGRIPYHSGGRAQQLVTVVENPADIIGVAAGGHGQVRRLLHNGYLGKFVQSSGLGRCFCSGG